MYNRGYSAGEFPAGPGGGRRRSSLTVVAGKETIPKQWRIRCGGLGAEQQVGGPKERLIRAQGPVRYRLVVVRRK